MINGENYKCVVKITGNCNTNEEQYEKLYNNYVSGYKDLVSYQIHIQEFEKCIRNDLDEIINDNIIIVFKFPLVSDNFVSFYIDRMTEVLNKLNCYDITFRSFDMMLHNDELDSYLMPNTKVEEPRSLWSLDILKLNDHHDDTYLTRVKRANWFDGSEVYDYNIEHRLKDEISVPNNKNFFKDKIIDEYMVTFGRVIDSADKPLKVFNTTKRVKMINKNLFTKEDPSLIDPLEYTEDI